MCRESVSVARIAECPAAAVARRPAAQDVGRTSGGHRAGAADPGAAERARRQVARRPGLAQGRRRLQEAAEARGGERRLVAALLGLSDQPAAVGRGRRRRRPRRRRRRRPQVHHRPHGAQQAAGARHLRPVQLLRLRVARGDSSPQQAEDPGGHSAEARHAARAQHDRTPQAQDSAPREAHRELRHAGRPARQVPARRDLPRGGRLPRQDHHGHRRRADQ